ncbi:MAG TPA: hypothetical protein VJR92_07000 [Gemmatimonadaceae bacterium]|nr:hypothetical protein [Gemmatimonadaceae bacterium]
MFGKQAFSEGLAALGYDAHDKGDNRVAFAYLIKAGRFADKSIRVGLEVPPDFNVTPPSGPHISPRLIPVNPGGAGNDRAAESPNFGPDWEYLSRPFVDQAAGWSRTTRDVKAYMRHVKRILETL